jgi:hypothetical protein
MTAQQSRFCLLMNASAALQLLIADEDATIQSAACNAVIMLYTEDPNYILN